MNTAVDERNPSLVWVKLCEEATLAIAEEPLLASYVYNCILNHRSLASALSVILANKLADEVMSAVSLRELFGEAFDAEPKLILAVRLLSDCSDLLDLLSADIDLLPVA